MENQTKSVFDDLFSPEEAADLEIRADLLAALQEWLKQTNGNQAMLAARLGVNQARISELKHGKISRFTIDKLIEMAARAGFAPKIHLERMPQVETRRRTPVAA